jgi:DNA-binding response OmpR family regulator
MEIIHLEDEGPLRDILKVALTSVDPEIEIRQFRNSDDAMVYIRHNWEAIDMLILDIRVPGSLDGLQTAEALRAEGFNATIILTSAHIRPTRDMLTALNCDWMPKPWHITEMTQKLLAQARKKRLNRRSRQGEENPS